MRVRLFIDPGFDYEPHEHRMQLRSYRHQGLDGAGFRGVGFLS